MSKIRQSNSSRAKASPYLKPAGENDKRVSVTLKSLRAMVGHAKALTFLPHQPAGSVLNGRHASRLRGRGLNFEEIRGYLPGDDVRSIDWKVTARTGKPHIRVFTEERDRPVLIVVDQRMSMFYGTALNMKSVTAAETAALIAFRILDQGDRVGGIVFGDEKIAEVRPERNQRSLNLFLSAVVEANTQLRADAPTVEPMPLNKTLEAVSQIARHDHLVIILSDFDGVDERTETMLCGLSRHNDVVIGLVSDPTAHAVQEGLHFVVSDGTLQAEIDTGSPQIRQALSDFSAGRFAEVERWARRAGIPVMPLSAGKETLPQIRQLFGLRRRSR